MVKHNPLVKDNSRWNNSETALIELLIRAGADVNQCGNGGVSPLMLATQGWNTELVSVLLTHGAEVNHCNIHGKSALVLASMYGPLKIVQQLVEAGAKVNGENNQQKDVLFAALGCGHFDIVNYLLLSDANIHSSQVEENSGLINCLSNSFDKTEEILPVLFAAGEPMDFSYINIPDSIKLCLEKASQRSLKNLSRIHIRQHLKMLHPGKNLIVLIEKLQLPTSIKSFLLFDINST